MPNLLSSLLDKDHHESFDAYMPCTSDFYSLVSKKLPCGWQINRNGIWFQCSSSQNTVPQQGWKIHVSATVVNAPEVLNRVSSVLLDSDSADFKFALDLSVLFFLNCKNWSRGGSGKFVTIYPRDNHHFLTLIEKIHQATLGFHGPYILSDHRYNNSGVVFYRYGGMRAYEVLNIKGERTPMLISPEGKEVPDERLPYPATPAWAAILLPIEAEQAQSQENHGLKKGRYQVEDVLSFSSAGGVYRALDRWSGATVVIKEARPCINSAMDGYDAVTLLKKEHRLLTSVEETKIAPRPIDLFQEWEHWFLVEEYIDGVPLSTHSSVHNILIRTRAVQEDIQKWYEIFRSLSASLIKIIGTLHRRNIVFSDLSTSNLMVPDGTAELKLIDFEGACEIGVDRPIGMCTPGFISGRRLAGSDAAMEDDYYAAGVVLMAYLLPVQRFFHLQPQAKQAMLASIEKDALLPNAVVQMILALMNQDPAQRPDCITVLQILESNREVANRQAPENNATALPDYADVIKGITNHLNGAATYRRRDRLFPADPKVFITNPLSLAYGASGIGYALDVITGKHQDDIIAWICSHKITPEAYPPGLYIGLSGIAWCLLEMGAQEEAEKIFRQTFDHRLLHQSPDIFYGTAGWGMANLRFFLETSNPIYLKHAECAGDRLLNSCIASDRGCFWETPNESNVGFAHGASGISLFLLYLFLVTGNECYLRASQQGLDFDLSFAAETKDGGMSWRQTTEALSPLYPYWRIGSAGVGVTVLRFYRLLGLERYRSILERIFIDVDRKYAVFPGRFTGLAGLGDFALDLYEFCGECQFLNAAHKVATGIMHFRVERQGIAFPGDSLSRLSCDYGTGSAGIALFLARLAGRRNSHFLLDSLLGERQTNPQGSQRQHHAHTAGRETPVL